MVLNAEEIVGGAVLRTIQIVVESSQYLLTGFVIAGALRGIVGHARLRAFLGSGRWTGPLKAWLGALAFLPVCALGVLPVLGELRRAAIPWRIILTFALAAPVLNPVSLMFGVSYLGLPLLGMLLAGLFVVSVGVGEIWAGLGPRLDPDSATEREAEPLPATGLGRLAAAAIHSARVATGPVMIDVVAGILGAAVLASLLSPSYLADTMFVGDPRAIPTMAAVAPLSYLTPDQGITAIPEMVKFRQSPGAMFLLLALGVGVTLGHFTWIGRDVGLRALALWTALTLGLSIGWAYAVDPLISPVGTVNADNDHFGRLANPYPPNEGLAGLPAKIGRELQDASTFRLIATGALAALILGGVVCRRIGDRLSFEAYATLRPAEPILDATVASPSIWSRELPKSWGRGLAGFGGLAVLLAGAFAYYPSPFEVFQDIQIVKADFYGELGARDHATPLYHLDLWDRLVNKLPLGATIRLQPPGTDSLRQTRELHDAIRSLRLALEKGEIGEAKSIFLRAQRATDSCRRSYLGP